jgi:hypothetical protein
MASPSLPNVGSVCIVRQAIPQKRWKNPTLREYAPNWIASLRMPGGVKKNHSTMYEICPLCLGTVGTPTSERPDCRCQKPARKHAEGLLEEARRTFKEGGSTNELRGQRRPKSDILLSTVFDLYEKHGPDDARDRTQAGVQILEQSTGIPYEKMTISLVVTGITARVLKWAAMRQEYASRGWNSRKGTAPADAWQTLRADWDAGKIKPVDFKTVRQVNTTIMSFLRSFKSIFSPKSRTLYLPGLKLPETNELRDTQLALPGPKGFRRLAPGKYAEMREAATKLKEEDLRKWLVLQLDWRVGWRTIELHAIKPHWLEKREGNPADAMNGTFLVLKNRPEEGFYLKGRTSATVRSIRLPQDIVNAIAKLQTPDCIFGTMSKTEMSDLGREVSAWIRQFIPDGPHTHYWFRHLAGALRYTTGDTKAAGALLGHRPGSTVTADTYIDLLAPVDALSDEELAANRLGLN